MGGTAVGGMDVGACVGSGATVGAVVGSTIGAVAVASADADVATTFAGGDDSSASDSGCVQPTPSSKTAAKTASKDTDFKNGFLFLVLSESLLTLPTTNIDCASFD